MSNLADAIPARWSLGKINCHDVNDELIDLDLDSDLITKTKLNSSYWTTAKLHRFIRDHASSVNDTWRFNKKANVLCIWDENSRESEPPLGFMAFYWNVDPVECGEETDDDEDGLICRHVSLSVDLVFVRADIRGHGVSKHLAAHFCNYLADCEIQKLIGQNEIWDFYYLADYYSEGGERFSQLIENQMMYLKESDCWPGIRDLVIEAGA